MRFENIPRAPQVSAVACIVSLFIIHETMDAVNMIVMPDRIAIQS